MTPEEVISFFETLVDDAPDVDAEYILMDAAYTKRNDSRAWSFLIKLSTAITHATSDTWQTSHSLPDDYAESIAVFGGATDNPYDPVPYENILAYINSSNKFSIDYQGENMRFTGRAGTALTVYHWYKMFPTSLIGLSAAQKASATTIVWPKRFAPILAYDMAEMYMGGIDSDDAAARMAPYQRSAYKALESAFIRWDNQRRMKMRDFSASPQRRGDNDQPDVVSW